jgi:probable rRNA maturation factor
MPRPEPPATAASVEVDFDVEAGLEDGWDGARSSTGLRTDLEQLVTAIVQRELPAGRYTVSLHLVGEDSIHELNRDHRAIDAPTDVLSFPLHDPNGMRFVLPPDQAVSLGDVAISWPSVVHQAAEFGHSPERELAYLTAHGVLHLLGYDHERELDRQRMRAREEEALGLLGFVR